MMKRQQTSYRNKLGKAGEDAAAAFLRKSGYEILARNYRAERGEIDIIVQKDRTLVFVEVKTSRNHLFGPPETWVDLRKQKQVGKIAQIYLMRETPDFETCRFDVIGVLAHDGRMEIHHIEDAFWLERGEDAF